MLRGHMEGPGVDKLPMAPAWGSCMNRSFSASQAPASMLSRPPALHTPKVGTLLTPHHSSFSNQL